MSAGQKKKRIKVLVSAYACEPDKGSEPGVGWNMAIHMAKFHDIWVLTRLNNEISIKAALAQNPVANLHFIYYDLPRWISFWKRGQRGVRLYYYLWQLGAAIYVYKIYKELKFDLGHHVTFVKYWSPSLFVFLKIPYIWGPVGGGESAPFKLYPSLGLKGFLYEVLRVTTRSICELDPLVRLTAKRAILVVAATPDTFARLKKIGARKVEIISQVALQVQEINNIASSRKSTAQIFTALSVGRLLAFKGFHLCIQAFAKSGLKEAVYLIVGDGPELGRLMELAFTMGIADRVKFLGNLPRSKVLEIMPQSHVLLHPSLHDSGGFVILEAMAAGLPVVCLDIGGPAMLLTKKTGFKILAKSKSQAVLDISDALKLVANDPALFSRMSKAAYLHVLEQFTWNKKVQIFNFYYEREYKKDNAFQNQSY